MAEYELYSDEEPVCELWRRFLQVLLVLSFMAGLILLGQYFAPSSRKQTPTPNNVGEQIEQLSREVAQLKQEQSMPAMVLHRYRDSICYLFGVYHISFPGKPPISRTRVSGSGFVVANGLVATNRHVAEPWFGDSEAEGLIRQGAVPQLENLLAFFPGIATPVKIAAVSVSQAADLAVLRLDDLAAAQELRPLPLAKDAPDPGDLVAVVGYPMGVLGMVAKSPNAVYERLALRRDDVGAANELAALSLIRPSATCGHLGDVVGDKLIYDAPTAHGGSGGPVFNSHGEVIAVNAAYIDGFSGGTLGISIKVLLPLMAQVKQKQLPAYENAAAR